MITLSLSTSQGNTSIFIDQHLISKIPNLIPHEHIFILADSNLKSSAEKLFQSLLSSGKSCHLRFFEMTEWNKSFEVAFPIYTELCNANVNRHSAFMTLGGGSLGDLGGFLAGTFMRGISWINIPSTLLAQVDSSIGGKTGFNHPHGKNLIGMFYHPSFVFSDVSLLETLPDREIISGFGEMIKYGLIGNLNFFNWLHQQLPLFMKRDVKTLMSAIQMCLAEKSKYIQQDEFDRLGIRECLNFGHTFGHALEASTNYTYFRHGEAILWGMKIASILSYQKGLLSVHELNHIFSIFDLVPIPNLPPSLSLERLISHLRYDKKNIKGESRWILLQGIGSAISRQTVSLKEVQTSFHFLLEKNLNEKHF